MPADRTLTFYSPIHITTNFLSLQFFDAWSFSIFCFIGPKGFQHKVMETLCTEKCYGKLAFQTLFVQDVYAAKGSKTFWY